MFKVLFAAAVLASQTAPPSTPPSAPSPAASRLDLARCYLAFERAMDERPPLAEARRPINEAIDRLTMFFFAGKNNEAIAALNETTASVLGIDGDARATFLALASQQAVFEPRDVIAGATPTVRCTFSPLIAHRGLPEGSTYIVTAPDGSTLAQPASGVLRLHDGDAARPGRYEISMTAAGSPRSVVIGSVCVLHRDAAATAVDLAKRLDALDAKNSTREADRAATRSRVALLTSAASKSAAFLADRSVLESEVSREVAELERDQSPWIGRRGEAWRTVRFDGADFPVRVLIPEAVGAGTRPPLIIALHGFGGDENMFLTGYGNGLLGRLAREKNFVVACPVTGNLSTSQKLFDAIVQEMVTCVDIDRSRVFLLGHSMGANAAARIAAARGDEIAGVVLIAGPGIVDTSGPDSPLQRTPPRLIVRGGIDPIARAAPGPYGLSTKVYPDEGHLLVVGRSLPDVVNWILEQKPLDAATQRTD